MKITHEKLISIIKEELTDVAKQQVHKNVEDVKKEVEEQLPKMAAIVQQLATDHRGEQVKSILGQIQAALNSFDDLDLK